MRSACSGNAARPPNKGMELSKPEYLAGSWPLSPNVTESGFAAHAQCSAGTTTTCMSNSITPPDGTEYPAWRAIKRYGQGSCRASRELAATGYGRCAERPGSLAPRVGSGASCPLQDGRVREACAGAPALAKRRPAGSRGASGKSR
jgi:hypothetical protein